MLLLLYTLHCIETILLYTDVSCLSRHTSCQPTVLTSMNSVPFLHFSILVFMYIILVHFCIYAFLTYQFTNFYIYSTHLEFYMHTPLLPSVTPTLAPVVYFAHHKVQYYSCTFHCLSLLTTSFMSGMQYVTSMSGGVSL